MEQIAARAGMTRKSVYNLIGAKDTIADRLVHDAEALPEPLYRERIELGQDALTILEKILSDSASWCTANPTLAKRALAPEKRPSLVPPSDRPNFQRLICDVLRLGQDQGSIRKDEDVNFLALLVLAVYAQAMLTALYTGEFTNPPIGKICRLVVEGIGTR